MLGALGRLRNLLSGARDGFRRDEMDGAHFATLGDRPFVGCRPCAPEPLGLADPTVEPAAISTFRTGTDEG